MFPALSIQRRCVLMYKVVGRTYTGQHIEMMVSSVALYACAVVEYIENIQTGERIYYENK